MVIVGRRLRFDRLSEPWTEPILKAWKGRHEGPGVRPRGEMIGGRTERQPVPGALALARPPRRRRAPGMPCCSEDGPKSGSVNFWMTSDMASLFRDFRDER